MDLKWQVGSNDIQSCIESSSKINGVEVDRPKTKLFHSTVRTNASTWHQAVLWRACKAIAVIDKPCLQMLESLKTIVVIRHLTMEGTFNWLNSEWLVL